MPKKNNIAALRDHLFETIERLKDPDEATPMDNATAHSICEAAQTIINSAKMELELVKAVSGSRPASLDFFGIPEEGRELPERSAARMLLAANRVHS